MDENIIEKINGQIQKEIVNSSFVFKKNKNFLMVYDQILENSSIALNIDKMKIETVLIDYYWLKVGWEEKSKFLMGWYKND